jgi:L-rhamnose mutarotase
MYIRCYSIKLKTTELQIKGKDNLYKMRHNKIWHTLQKLAINSKIKNDDIKDKILDNTTNRLKSNKVYKILQRDYLPSNAARYSSNCFFRSVLK